MWNTHGAQLFLMPDNKGCPQVANEDMLTSQCLNQQRAGQGGNFIKPALYAPCMLYLAQP
ncbi:hypothetical protein DFO55_102526 [Grimontella sp. AG753]|jgi:hypothetical protein|nr:hypothetical protein DFO55_102526 [Grimontella sp. AG753]